MSNRIGRVRQAVSRIGERTAALQLGRLSAVQWRRQTVGTHPVVQVSAVALVFLAAAAFLLLPAAEALPYQFTLGAWAPLPKLSIVLAYRYDGLSHLFAFLAIVVVGSILLCPGALRTVGGRATGLLLVMLLVFGHYLAIVDLVALYVAWELLGWLGWLLLRPVHQQGGNGGLLVAHITGYGLLAAVVMLASVSGGTQLATVAQPELLAAPLLPLLLLPAAARAGQFPFHGWLASAGRAPAPIGALLLTGVLANAGPYLLARSAHVAGGTWPAMGRTVAVEYALAAILISSLLAWRAEQPGRALVYAAGADLGLVLLGLIAGTPASLAAALLVLVNNSLALAALLLAANPSNGATGGGRTARRGAGRLTTIVAAASLIGVPPTLGFTARWQLLTVLLGSGLLGPVAALAIAAIPRNLALLRATAALVAVARGADDGPARTTHAGSLSGAIAPAALLTVFGVLPWLPQRYLIAPAVSAITGAQTVAAALPITGAGMPYAVLAGALLVAVLAAAIFYDVGAGQAFVPGGEMLRLPAPLRTTLLVGGSVCHMLATALLNLAERAAAGGWQIVRSAADRISRRGDALAPRFEDQYYVATVLLLAIAVSLALVG